jgi:SAM-dependent methyltransferase
LTNTPLVTEQPHGGELTVIREALLDEATLVRAVASGRQRNTTVPFRRVELRYVDLSAGRRLQVTSYDDTSAHIRNVGLERAEDVVDELLATPFASWHVASVTETLQLRVTKKGRPLLHRAPTPGPAAEPSRSHDRRKSRRLDESDPLFRVLGITTADGQVKPTRVAKFRQVQELLAAVDPVVDDAVALGPGASMSAERPLRVADLGCGNAYLTFAAVRYLTCVRGLPTRATGVDVKAQSRAHNRATAAELGLTDQMEFVDSSIAAARLEHEPDLVMALHACDTASDEALARAVTWGTPVIVVAPCCHHDIARQLRREHTPDAYRLVTRHGILKERFADVLTDALRAAILRLVGYRTEVIEFVDSRHTPRNTLIRAVRTGAHADDKTLQDYRELVRAWSVKPALAGMLSDGYPFLTDIAAS